MSPQRTTSWAPTSWLALVCCLIWSISLILVEPKPCTAISAITRQPLGAGSSRQVTVAALASNRTGLSSISQIAALFAAKPRAASAGDGRQNGAPSKQHQTLMGSASSLRSSIRGPPDGPTDNPKQAEPIQSVQVNSKAGRKLARMQTKRQTPESGAELSSGPLSGAASRRNEDPWFLDQAPYPLQPYRFNYNVKARDGSTEQYRQEVGDGKFLTGSYGYVLPDGIYRHVDYVADDRGFRAFIRTSEPGTANQNPANVVIQANPLTVSPGVSYATGSYPSSASSGPTFHQSSFGSVSGGRGGGGSPNDEGSISGDLLRQPISDWSQLPRRAPGSIVGAPVRNFSSFSFGPGPLQAAPLDPTPSLDATSGRLRANSLLGPLPSWQAGRFQSLGVAPATGPTTNYSARGDSLPADGQQQQQQQQVDHLDNEASPEWRNRFGPLHRQQAAGATKSASDHQPDYGRLQANAGAEPGRAPGPPTRGAADLANDPRQRHLLSGRLVQPLLWPASPASGEPRPRAAHLGPWAPAVPRTGPDVLAYDRPFSSLVGGARKLHYDNEHLLHPDSGARLAIERAHSLAQLERLNAANSLFANRRLAPSLAWPELGTLQPLAGGGSSEVSGRSEQHHQWAQQSSRQLVDNANKVTLTSQQASGSSSGSGREFGLATGHSSGHRQPPPQPVFSHSHSQPPVAGLRQQDAVKGGGQQGAGKGRVAPYAAEPPSQHFEAPQEQRPQPAASSPSGPREPEEPRPPGEPVSPQPVPVAGEPAHGPLGASTSSGPAATTAAIATTTTKPPSGVKGPQQQQQQQLVRSARMPEELRASSYMLMNDLRAMQNAIGLPQPPRLQRSSQPSSDFEERGLSLAEQLVSARMRRVDGLVSGGAPAAAAAGSRPSEAASPSSSSAVVAATSAPAMHQQAPAGNQTGGSLAKPAHEPNKWLLASREPLPAGPLADNLIQVGPAKPVELADERRRLSSGPMTIVRSSADSSARLQGASKAQLMAAPPDQEPTPPAAVSFEAQRLNQTHKNRLQAEKVSELEKFQQRLRTQQLLLEQLKSNANANQQPELGGALVRVAANAGPQVGPKSKAAQSPASGQQVNASQLKRGPVALAEAGNETLAMADLNSQVNYDDQLDGGKLTVSQFNRLRRQNEPQLAGEPRSAGNSSSGNARNSGAENPPKRPAPQGHHFKVEAARPWNSSKEQLNQLAANKTAPITGPSLAINDNNIDTQSADKSLGPQLKPRRDTEANSSSSAVEQQQQRPANTINLDFINSVTALSVDQLNPFAIASVNPGVQQQRLSPHRLGLLAHTADPGPQSGLGASGVATAPARYRNSAELVALMAHRQRQADELQQQQQLMQARQASPAWPPSNHRLEPSDLADASRVQLAPYAMPDRPQVSASAEASESQPSRDLESKPQAAESRRMFSLRNEPPIVASAAPATTTTTPPTPKQATSRKQVVSQLARELNLQHQHDGFDARNRAIQVDNHRFFEVVSSGRSETSLPVGDSSAAFQAFRDAQLTISANNKRRRRK